MPLNRNQKQEIVQEIKEKLSRKKVALFASFNGVDVKSSSEFRKNVRALNGDYKVIKKTLLARVLDELHLSVPQDALTGEVGVAIDYESETNVAKALLNASRKSKFTILGGIMGDAFFDALQAKELALLPSLDVMRGRVAYMLQSPVTGLVRTLSGVQLKFLRVLEGIKEKKA